ncbi:MAG TPA: cytidylate kinase-like family protein [Terriglobales bacterium]|nr:cytidylate kinase-like family protein [Terriglobales bacterium]
MFRVITIEREFGSGAGAIAEKLASRLGWKLWDHALTEEIAKIANVDCATVEQFDERVDSTLRRVTRAFWRGSFERRIPLDDSQIFDTDCMVSMVKRIMQRIVNEGNAIVVGRGSPYFLRERQDTFRVFTYAPRDEKIRRLVQFGRSQEEAEDLVDTVDRERIAYVKHYFNADWPTRSLYHLMINTAMGDENVISTILHNMRTLEHANLSPTALRGVK